MAVIALEGMHFNAHHGFYKEERIIGNEFIVDVYITTRFEKAAIDEDLSKTINYETVYLICKAAMKIPTLLLETVGERIGLGIRHQFRNITNLKIRVRKLNPPLGGQVDSAYVEVDGDYKKKCGRCSRPLLCYGDNSCWCMESRVHNRTLKQLKGQYGNQCLCKECLSFFAK